jgi:hypothetical protein
MAQEPIAIDVPKYEIARLELKKGDTVVFRTPDRLAPDQQGYLLGQLKEAFPGHVILILERGMSIDVLKKNEGTEVG